MSCQSSSTLSNLVWHSVSGVFDSVGVNPLFQPTLKLFINGAQECVVTAAGQVYPGSGNNLKLGVDSTASNAWAGSIADLRTYGVALGSAAVTAHDRAARPRFGAQYSATVLADAPIGYFRLNESSGTLAVNSGTAGTALAGTYTGGVALNQSGALPGDSDSAAGFNGASNYVDLQAGPVMSNRLQGAIELWVSSTVTNLPGEQAIYDESNVSGTVWRVRRYGQAIGFERYNGGSFPFLTTPNLTWGAGIWHHVVATWQPGSRQIWVDGSLAASDTLTGPTNVAPAVIHSWIGRYGQAGNFFDGKIDEFALYSSPLSPARIRNHYQTGLLP